MKRCPILLCVFALALLAGSLGSGCSKKEKKLKELVEVSAVRLFNIRNLAIACIKYEYAHEEDRIPNSLQDVKAYMPDGTIPESPGKPEDFDGPSYILVQPLAGKKFGQFSPSHKYVIVYENPAFCTVEINVGFLDGHYMKMTLPAFRQALEDTYKLLGLPMPEPAP